MREETHAIPSPDIVVLAIGQNVLTHLLILPTQEQHMNTVVP